MILKSFITNALNSKLIWKNTFLIPFEVLLNPFGNKVGINKCISLLLNTFSLPTYFIWDFLLRKDFPLPAEYQDGLFQGTIELSPPPVIFMQM